MVDDHISTLIKDTHEDPDLQRVFYDLVCRSALRKLCICTVKEIIFTRLTKSEEEKGSSNCETKDEYLEKEDDISYILWTDTEEAFIHAASSIWYTPKGEVYYSWISEEEHNMRMLFYTFVDGSLTLIKDGNFGIKKGDMLSHQDYDKKFIFLEKSEAYHPDRLGGIL